MKVEVDVQGSLSHNSPYSLRGRNATLKTMKNLAKYAHSLLTVIQHSSHPRLHSCIKEINRLCFGSSSVVCIVLDLFLR